MHDKNQDGVNQLINEIKESKYHSHKAEPLAKTINRNYEWPEEVKNGD